MFNSFHEVSWLFSQQVSGMISTQQLEAPQLNEGNNLVQALGKALVASGCKDFDQTLWKPDPKQVLIITCTFSAVTQNVDGNTAPPNKPTNTSPFFYKRFSHNFWSRCNHRVFLHLKFGFYDNFYDYIQSLRSIGLHLGQHIKKSIKTRFFLVAKAYSFMGLGPLTGFDGIINGFPLLSSTNQRVFGSFPWPRRVEEASTFPVPLRLRGAESWPKTIRGSGWSPPPHGVLPRDSH